MQRSAAERRCTVHRHAAGACEAAHRLLSRNTSSCWATNSTGFTGRAAATARSAKATASCTSGCSDKNEDCIAICTPSTHTHTHTHTSPTSLHGRTRSRNKSLALDMPLHSQVRSAREQPEPDADTVAARLNVIDAPIAAHDGKPARVRSHADANDVTN
jgi:hypothetical protein